jgi:phosphoribosylaminoimidazole-succinocarboxamide synthase
MSELVKKGKVKEVWRINENELEFRFTDQISVFDKIIPTLIPSKGETLCRTSAYWFRELEEIGIPTHYIGLTSPTTMRVRRVDIPQSYEEISTSNKGFLIPLEWISRYYVAGSLNDRLKEGKIDPRGLGFPKGYVPELGEALPQPFHEVTTKIEKVDRPLTKSEALSLTGLAEEQSNSIWQYIKIIDSEIKHSVENRGLIHVDGKKEWAIDGNGEVMLVDTFGTADEDRFWDKRAYEEEGKRVELSKEFVRQYYRRTGYYDRLMEARGELKRTEPEIPGLPEDVAAEVSKLYIDLFERITGQEFRPKKVA